MALSRRHPQPDSTDSPETILLPGDALHRTQHDNVRRHARKLNPKGHQPPAHLKNSSLAIQPKKKGPRTPFPRKTSARCATAMSIACALCRCSFVMFKYRLVPMCTHRPKPASPPSRHLAAHPSAPPAIRAAHSLARTRERAAPSAGARHVPRARARRSARCRGSTVRGIAAAFLRRPMRERTCLAHRKFVKAHEVQGPAGETGTVVNVVSAANVQRKQA
jgi:hypothetical protein